MCKCMGIAARRKAQGFRIWFETGTYTLAKGASKLKIGAATTAVKHVRAQRKNTPAVIVAPIFKFDAPWQLGYVARTFCTFRWLIFLVLFFESRAKYFSFQLRREIGYIDSRKIILFNFYFVNYYYENILSFFFKLRIVRL